MALLSPAYAFSIPGGSWGPNEIVRMLAAGERLRDGVIWSYPFIGQAIKTCVEIAATREWRISGQERNVSRSFEYLHGAATFNHDGIVEYGFEQWVKRIYTDNLIIGRQLWTWGEDAPLRYLDPVWTHFDLQERIWNENYTREEFPVERVVVYHPIPFGADGKFLAPVAPVIPSSMLMWLIREHDKAAADGRKIRDIFITKGEELAEQLREAIIDSVATWAGADPTKQGVNVVSYDDPLGSSKASDTIYRLGLANIPENFDREGFTMEYVNEISSALGLAMRHFYNGQENGTNRSLEEVQEARQQVKGPAAFIRTLQRQINQSGALKQFGKNLRFAFVEEVDTQTLLSRANVLKLYSDALANFVDKLSGYVNIESLVAWLQADDILPADLEIITGARAENKNQLKDSDPKPTPNAANNEVIKNSDPQPTTDNIEKEAPLDYDEITIDQDGRVVERREKVFSFHKILERKIREELFAKKTDEQHTPKKFTDLLAELRLRYLEKFIDTPIAKFDGEDADEVLRIRSMEKSLLSQEDYRQIRRLIEKVGVTLWD